MLLENYRRDETDTLMGGSDAFLIPYPIISTEDWKIWAAFLPIRQEEFTGESARNLRVGSTGENSAYGIPRSVVKEINKAGNVFPKIEIWRKKNINKDPIAVGLIGNKRYLIARWGNEDELIPFGTIKRRVSMIKLARVAFHSAFILVMWLLML